MSTLGCKNCGRRKSRNLKEEIIIIEDPKPTYVINPINNTSPAPNIIDWKSMSKVI